MRNAFGFLNRTDGSVADRALRSGFWVGAASALTSVLRFLGSLVLARLLSPDQFGLMAIAGFLIGAVDVMSQPGLSAAIIHRKDRLADAVNQAWTILILRGLALAGLVALCSGLVADFYGEPTLRPVVAVIAAVFVIQGWTNSHVILLRKEMNFKRLAVLESAVSLVHLAVLIALAWVTRSIWALVVGRIALAALRVAASYTATPARPRLVRPGALVGELFRYGKFVTGAAIVTFLATNVDNALVGKVLGMTWLGYYGVAYSLANLPATHLTTVISQVFFPAFTKLQDRPEAFRHAYLTVLQVVTAGTVPIGAGLALVADEFVATLYGTQWLPMVPALRVLCLFGVVRVLVATTQPIFLAGGRPRVNFYLALLKLALIAGLIYPLTRHSGIHGTAWAVTLPALLELAILWIAAARLLDCPLSRIVRCLAAPLASAAAMAACVLWVGRSLADSAEIWMLAASVGAGVLTYLAALALLDRHSLPGFRHRLREALQGRETP